MGHLWLKKPGNSSNCLFLRARKAPRIRIVALWRRAGQIEGINETRSANAEQTRTIRNGGRNVFMDFNGREHRNFPIDRPNTEYKQAEDGPRWSRRRVAASRAPHRPERHVLTHTHVRARAYSYASRRSTHSEISIGGGVRVFYLLGQTS